MVFWKGRWIDRERQDKPEWLRVFFSRRMVWVERVLLFCLRAVFCLHVVKHVKWVWGANDSELLALQGTPVGYDPRRRRPRNWGNDIDSMELQQFLPLCLLVFVGVTDGRKKIRRNGWVGYKIRHHCLLWNISFVCLRRLFYQYTMVNHHWSAAIWRASFTKNPTTFKQI